MSEHWGGARPGAGRPRHFLKVKMDTETWDDLAKLLQQRREETNTSDLSESDVVRELIHQAVVSKRQKQKKPKERD